MGHVQSKRKRERKKRKMSQILKGLTTTSEPADNIHQVEGHRIYRDDNGVSTDQFSNSSGYFSSESSPPSSGNDVNWYTNEVLSHDIGYSGKNIAANQKCDKDGFNLFPLETCQDYKGVTIDDHPVLTKLQNEQNARLESMEQRIAKIRTNAQQAYDRKKFAHLFRAKKDHSQTDRLLLEAKEMLQKNIEEKKYDSDKDVINNNDYTGEIIPVKVIDKEDNPDRDDCHDDERYLQLAPFESLNLSKYLLTVKSMNFWAHTNFIVNT